MPAVAAREAGTPAEAQGLTAEARDHDPRRRRKAGRAAALVVAVAVGAGIAWTGGFSGSRPASGSPGQPARLTAHTGEVTGYIDPCEGIDIGLPYAAGTVTALSGRPTWKPDGHGTSRLQLPATVAARQHVDENHTFRFDLAPGQYVLMARYDGGNAVSFLDVTIAAGRDLNRNLPDLCK